MARWHNTPLNRSSSPSREPLNSTWVRSKLPELLRGRDVAVVYAVLVGMMTIVVATQPPAHLRDIVQTSSTNSGSGH
jgi:hypothetical protein